MTEETNRYEYNIELIEKFRTGDIEALEALLKNNLALVADISKKFLYRNYEYNDIFQTGCLGLLKAIMKFDNSFGVKFSTYAYPMIVGEIKRFIRDDGIVKVSRSIKTTARKINHDKEMLSKNLQREPTMEELSIYSGVGMDDMVFAMESCCSVQYLYDVVHQDDGSPVLLIDKLCESSRDGWEMVESIALREAIESLAPKLRKVIILRYYLDKTQSQVANIMGISQVEVSRTERKVLNVMREKLS
ncbi:MAG: SigF/SigG family RNA polymerase sporulation sigma factor [Clostridiaceae bacterium]